MASNAVVDDKISVASVLGSSRVQITSRQFGGGRVIAVVGSGEVDLRKAALAADGAKVTIVTALGSVATSRPRRLGRQRADGDGFGLSYV